MWNVEKVFSVESGEMFALVGSVEIGELVELVELAELVGSVGSVALVELVEAVERTVEVVCSAETVGAFCLDILVLSLDQLLDKNFPAVRRTSQRPAHIYCH
jgi:hypothetical protein